MSDGRSESEYRPINLGGRERALSIALGSALLWRALGGALFGPFLMTLGGAALVWRGRSGHCAVKERMCANRLADDDRASPPGRRVPRRGAARPADAVDRTSEDSFPASDPPSWIPTNGPLRRH
jgi:hypothetical protein